MAKKNKWLTDEEVEAEIKELSKSHYVKLARKELRLKYQKRQRLYQLRNLEKRGRHLEVEGITLENIEEMIAQQEQQIKEDSEE